VGAAAIIVSYRTGPALDACLAAVAQAEGLDEIIVIDNGNPEPAQSAIDAFASADARVCILRGQGNIGFAAASNRGARAARSELVAFINPDVLLHPDAVSRLIGALQTAPAPALIGGDLRDEQGKPERGSRRERLTLWRAFVAFTGLSHLERLAPSLRDFNRHTDPMPMQPVAVGAVSGALMLTRRADFEALGGFDEGYFLHVEDIDLCRRAEEAGWRVLFAPGPHGVHLRSTSDADAAEIGRHKARGMARYFNKFARGPVERALAAAAGAFLIAVAPRGRRA
jgi:N-acetylglucosaminyl-diphospho-decaprenol L-rhamnosyltransferase